MAYFTRSRVLSEHKAAGVLPFCLHDNTVLVLLGAEPCRTGPGGKLYRTMWRDFGGRREAQDLDSAATAAREFAEETLGLFGGCGVDAASVALAAAAFEAQLRDPLQALKVVYTLKKGSYHFFMTQTPFVAPLMFRLASEQNAATGAVPGGEKSAFAWVPLRAVLECVAATAPRYFLEAQAHVCGREDTPPPAKCGRRRFQLHPCFANSLRQAQRCGLQELLARAKELPLPPLPAPLPSMLLQPAAQPAGSTLGSAGVGGSGGGAAVDSAAAAAAAVEEAAAEEVAGVAAAQAEMPVEVAAVEMVVAAATEAEAAAAGEEEEEEEEAGQPFGSSLMDHSLGHWLAQAEIAAALESSGFAIPAAGAGALPAGLLLPTLAPEQLLPLPEAQGGKKRRRQRRRQGQGQGGPIDGRQQEGLGATAAAAAATAALSRGVAAAALAPAGLVRAAGAPAVAAAAAAAVAEAAGHRAGACMPPASADATSSQARPASSVDTASSLRQSLQAAAAAAVGEVVSQIQHNSQQPHTHRLSRKQRQQRRQQRQREAAGRAAAADPSRASQGVPAAAGPAAGGPPTSPAAAPPRAHWHHAAAELQAEFQPRLRHSKRLRLQVAA